MTALNPVMRVGRQIAEAIWVHEPALRKAEVRARVLRVLELAAVPEPSRRAEQYPHQLSGGLRQRVMIAIALAARPGVLIADEPTTALDLTLQQQIVRLLVGLREQLKLSLLFITHDLAVAAQLVDRLAVMYAGRIVEEGATSAVLGEPRHPYTQALLAAARRLGGSKFAPAPGVLGAVGAPAPGCAFAPRCPRHLASCDARVPDLVGVPDHSEGHRARCILAAPGEKEGLAN